MYDVLQVSVDHDHQPREIGRFTSGEVVNLVRGDHATDLNRICECLEPAKVYAIINTQIEAIDMIVESFVTGNLEKYRESLIPWIKDKQPSIETAFGFTESYRNPAGVRSEFEGVVAIVDEEGTKELTQLANMSQEFIALLPWVAGASGGGRNGPFDIDQYETPDFQPDCPATVSDFRKLTRTARQSYLLESIYPTYVRYPTTLLYR